jgi:hypothetical protein
MTKENAKRGYDYAMSTGNVSRAENILIRHPEFKEVPVEETKSKGKK